MKLQFALTAAAALALFSGNAQAQLSVDDFEATPVFTDNFAAGVATGQWELDPLNNQAGVLTATFETSTPAGINAAVVTLNPVATAVDGAVMVMGNDSSTAGSHFGLNYMRVVNSLANGSGDSFLTLNRYRWVARVYLYSTTEITNRWQVGPYALSNADLFRASAFYNTNATGGGPGFGFRGASIANGVIDAGTTAIPSARWTLMSIMVDKSDATAANWQLAVCVDANGNGVLDEADPLEYRALTLNANRLDGPPGIFTVGEVYRNTFPLFVDWVELYEWAEPTKAEAWEMYY